MQTVLGILLFSSVFLAGTCWSSESSECLTIDEKKHLDDVLLKVRSVLPDPIRLPPRSSFVDLEDGVLWGLSNLTRLGDAKVKCDGTTTVVKLTLTTDELKGRYTWSKERKLHSDKEGYVVFISNDFQAEVEVTIDQLESQKIHPQLKRLEIMRFKDARIETTGLGFLTWTVGEMTTLLSGIFQRSIARAIQGPLKEALERELREITVDA